MRIAIIGAGFTGLTAALRLSQKGHKVTVFEKQKNAGGLSGSFGEKNWEWPLEYFFHHLFASDSTVKNLINELGLSNKLFYRQPKTSVFFQGKISQFDSFLSIIEFPYLNLPEKLRTGIVTLYLKTIENWKPFEKISAFDWLGKYYGKKPFEVLWKPLILAKFGKFADQISMAWFWARIKKRSFNLGYLEGGFQTLTDKLIEKIQKNNGKIYFNHNICCSDDLNHDNKFDRVIFTTPNSTFLKIISSLPKGYKEKFSKLKMIGALNLILILKKKFLTDGTYWLNINDQGFPFVAVVEHTNFIDPKYYNGQHILYVGGYYPQNHRYFKMDKTQILKEFLPSLQKINPKFNFQLDAKRYTLYANLHAQPIIPLNYSQLIPSHQTPIANVYLANMQQIYPWDRGTNYAIELGEKIANEIENS